MPLKPFLNAFHDLVRWLGHVALIPVIAAMKGLDALIQHLVSELSKV